jgi:hypothetical protein
LLIIIYIYIMVPTNSLFSGYRWGEWKKRALCSGHHSR